jgi:BirA family biotin operon repressor/biotin-[acetyl-CoA-carboxylase] ligase
MKVLEKDCKGLHLKWPNDIILKGKKLGGILCEDFGDFSIIGIGLNFENEPDIDNSTNLISNNILMDKSFFLASFLYNFDLKSSLTSEEIIDKFTEYDCLIDKEVFWEGSSGIAKSIALDGSLIVESNDKEFNLYSEEVHLERH